MFSDRHSDILGSGFLYTNHSVRLVPDVHTESKFAAWRFVVGLPPMSEPRIPPCRALR